MPRPGRRLTVLVAAAAAVAAIMTLAFVTLHRRSETGTTRPAAAAGQRPAPETTNPSAPTHSVLSHRVSDVVALGDSVPAGSGCGCVAYPSLVARRLGAREGQPVRVHNMSQPGLTTRGLLAELTRPSMRRAISTAGLVIVTVGANDLENRSGKTDCDPSGATDCFRAPLAQLPALYDQLLDRVRALLRDRRAPVVVTGYWNVFLDGAVARRHGQAYVDNSRRLTEQVNSAIAWSAATHDSGYIDVGTPFSGNGGDDTFLLAPDGDHPNAQGHRVIAQAIDVGLGLDN